MPRYRECPGRESNMSPRERKTNGLGDFQRKPSTALAFISAPVRWCPAPSGPVRLSYGHLTATNSLWRESQLPQEDRRAVRPGSRGQSRGYRFAFLALHSNVVAQERG